MSDSPPVPLGTLLGNKYRLDRLLRRGGMGAVYLAENVDIGRRVAIKVLLPEVARDADALARFRTEARAAAAIGHPNIAEVIDLGTAWDGGAYLVMEYLQGETLGGRLRRAGPLDVETLGWMGDELLAAVAAAHAKGVIHRDLKPENVFLTDQPVRGLKVLDFGVSKFRQPGDVALTRTGIVMGTPSYMSPEQARGAKDVGPATDLYAVGAILYEALAGAPAFSGDSYNEVIAKVLTEPHPPLQQVRPELPPALVALVDRLLSKSPAARGADALEVRSALSQAARSAQVVLQTARPGSVKPTPAAFAATAPPRATPPAAARPLDTQLAAPRNPLAAPPSPLAAAPPTPAPPPPLAAPAAAPAAQARPKQKKGVFRWVAVAFVFVMGIKACHACEDCASRVAEAGAQGLPAIPSVKVAPGEVSIEGANGLRLKARRQHAEVGFVGADGGLAAVMKEAERAAAAAAREIMEQNGVEPPDPAEEPLPAGPPEIPEPPPGYVP